MDHCKVSAGSKQWGSFKEFLKGKGLLDVGDRNLVDYRGLGIEAQRAGKEGEKEKGDWWNEGTGRFGGFEEKKEATNPQPPPMPPHRVLMEARRAWEGVAEALKEMVGEDGVVGPAELGDALARNGVLVSAADANSVWEAIIGEGTERAGVAETVSKLKPTPRAGKGSIEEWGERFQTPAFISGMIGNDIFSGVQQARERKHFGDIHNVGGKDTITKDVLGGEGARGDSEWDGGDGGVTESAPYYLDGQKVMPPSPPGRDIHARPDSEYTWEGWGSGTGGVGAGASASGSPLRTPYALQTELGGEHGRRKEEAEGTPNLLLRAIERAEIMRTERGCGRTPKNDVVWLCMPDVGYKRTLDMSRSEVFQVFNKMQVKVKGGDMERLWWWMEKTGKGFSREEFYALLGGEVATTDSGPKDAQEDNGEELSVEKRRKLHSVCLKANAIIRGCAHFDAGGDGKVAVEVFVDALGKSVDGVGEGDIDMVLDAVQGGQEDKSYVKYSGLVFKIGLYLDKHTKAKEEVVDEGKKRSEKNVMISGAELFGGDIYTHSSNQVYEGGKKHFEGRGGGGGRDHLQGDYMEKDSSDVEVQEERRRYGVDLHRGWGSGGRKHFEGRGGGGGKDHLRGEYMELDPSDPRVQEERAKYGVNLHWGWGSGGKKRFEGREGGGGRDHFRGNYMELDASDPRVQAERKRYGVVNEVMGKGKRHYSADDYIPAATEGGEEGRGGEEGGRGGEGGEEGMREERKEGIDQFGYLRINAPQPAEVKRELVNTRRRRTSART